MKENAIRLFISGEVDASVSNEFRLVRNRIEKKIQSELLNRNNYGDGVIKLTIIPIILGPNFEKILDYKERKLFSHRKKESDIRLKIDYEVFKKGSDKKREKLIVQNIIESISIIKTKVKGEFDADKLINDISRLFELK
jgi:hypothetical protein